MGIVYLIYALVVDAAIVWANGVLLAVSFAYLLFFIITYYNRSRGMSKAKRITARTVKWAKLIIKAFTLGVAVYGIYIAIEKFTPVSALLMTASVLGWVIQVFVELLVVYAENRVQFLMAGIEADVDNLLKPVKSTVNFVRRVTGKEIEKPEEPTKNRLALDKLVTERREYRARIKAEEKRTSLELQAQRREEKRENRRRFVSRAKAQILSTLRTKKKEQKQAALPEPETVERETVSADK